MKEALPHLLPKIAKEHQIETTANKILTTKNLKRPHATKTTITRRVRSRKA